MENNEGEPAGETEPLEILRARPLTEEEKYFYEQSYKQLVEGIGRIEEVAKFMVGATATTSGLFLAAVKLVLGNATVSGTIWLLPFMAWALGIVFLILVLFPQRYTAKRNQPTAWKAAFLRARRNKFILLCLGTLSFVAGILLALVPFGPQVGL